MIRAAQALYDFWLDLTGVTVGRYRFVVWLICNVAFDAALALPISSSLLRVAVFGFYVAVDVGYWRFVSPTWRPRAVLDDRDQEARKHQNVNSRALASAQYFWPHVSVSFAVGLLLFFMCGWKFGFALLGFLSIDANECLMVRDRDPSRFAWRGMKFAAGAA